MKALVLAGGLPQIALLNELKSRGYVTVLADYFPNPVAKPYADIFYQVSTLDVPAIKGVAIKEKVDFLITVCTDQALLTVAQVSEDLGLPCYINYQTALNVTNKFYMKKVFAEKGISTAKFHVMSQLDMKKIENLSYPLIVKPVDCNSSKGVKRVDDPSQLPVAFAEAVALSRTDNAIVEEFIVGPELSVDLYVENGIAHVLSISELDKIPQQNKFIIFRSKTPKEMSAALYAQIRETAQQIADAFELRNSPMLIQMISNGKRVFVLEFSARTGGGEKFIMIRKVSGFDVIKAVVDLTEGQHPHVDENAAHKEFFASEFIYCKPGVFDHLEGFKQLLEQGVLSDYYLFKSAGYKFDTVENSGDRVAGFSIIADNREQLIQMHNEAVAQLKVINAKGNDMMRHDLLTDLY